MADIKMMEKLNVFAKNIVTQHGEDGIIEYILEKLPNCPKTCMEFGAWDGKFLSNTYRLWHDQNWKAVLVESDKERCEALVRDYSDYDVSIFNQFLEIRGEYSIDNLYRKNNIEPEIGIASIDIDSTDYHIWKNMEYIKPWIVIIEHNHSIPGYIDYNDPEGEIYLRCSAKALERLGREKGYKMICCTVTNSFFVRNDLFNNEFFPDMPVEWLFDYSHCDGVQMLPLLEYPAPVFYGYPGFVKKNFSFLFCRLKALLQMKKYRKPSDKIRKHLEKYNITIG